ncbi:MAG: cupredoxin domain-containing protein [Rhodospirillales bacterium]|nr:MAG: cupredoxin domain-containing protein [Rhodospirillales bacterium]
MVVLTLHLAIFRLLLGLSAGPRRGRAGAILAVAGTALVSGCVPADDQFGHPRDGYPADAVTMTAPVDWHAAQTIEVVLTEFGYEPATLKFRKDQPYVLKLTNTGSLPHRFQAEEFFRAIATRSVIYEDAEAGYPFLDAIALDPEETKTLRFVPVTPGDYRLSCDLTLHATFGMVGRILIE